MPDKLLYQEEDGIARITINRPSSRNCLDIETLNAWNKAIHDIAQNPDVKVLTVRGSEGNFSAGADLAMFLNAIEAGDRRTIDRFIEKIHEVTSGLEKLRIPTIAAVEGFALAGGLEVLLACDLRIVTEEATIGDQHANYGLVAGGGGTQRLIRQIDTCLAKELMFTGRRLTGKEAEEWGIVNRAIPATQFESELSELETELANKSRNAASMTKFLMHEGSQVDMETGLELERRTVVDHYFTDEAIEGFTAFNEDREPEF